ncbi:hypothetical protein ACHAXH_005512 [Discostella pseudostelligera]
MGIDIFAPLSQSEQLLAHSFGEFSHFVLHTAKEACLEILEMELHNSGRGGGESSVGVLQGGSDTHSIYRVSFPTTSENYDHGSGKKKTKKNNDNNAAVQLLHLYNQQCTNKSSMLTMDDIQRYMLEMLRRRQFHNSYRDGGYTRLGNLMFILQFGGPTLGQVRHIDNMLPNVQICLYMSYRCPSTIVYVVDDLDGLPVTDGETLVEFWERLQEDQQENVKHRPVPTLVKQVLLENGDRKLKDAWYTQYFTRWNTINCQLQCFGKLYQPVSHTLALDAVPPGTTLIAGGNDIHAGPPTTESRMFAFAIGISECVDNEYYEEGTDDYDHDDDASGVEEKVNDGEVQYSPVLLHNDLCCLLFSILENEYNTLEKEDLVREAKVFLVRVLIRLLRDCPTKQYLLQIDEDRMGVRIWLDKVISNLLGNDDEHSIDDLIEEAAGSDTILYSPDVVKRRSKRKKVRYKSKLKGSYGK